MPVLLIFSSLGRADGQIILRVRGAHGHEPGKVITILHVFHIFLQLRTEIDKKFLVHGFFLEGREMQRTANKQKNKNQTLFFRALLTTNTTLFHHFKLF